jgi:hypothetical protein
MGFALRAHERTFGRPFTPAASILSEAAVLKYPFAVKLKTRT